MMKHFATGCALLMLVGWTTADVAAQSRVGTTAAPFLTLGTGARGMSLGHAYRSVARGADALFWNPAGAARPYEGNRGSVMLTNYEWVADIGYYGAGVVIPAGGAGGLGLSVAFVDYGRMDVRTVELPNGTGETFASSDLSVGLSYAQPLTSSFYFGGTVKIVQQKIRDMTARTAAFDVGFVLETQYLNGLTLSASIMNFGGKMSMAGVNTDIFVDIAPGNSGSNPNLPANLDTDSWDLPLSFRFGASLPVYQANNVALRLLADANQTNDNNLNSDVGAELHYGTRTVNFDLRAGYRDLFLDNVDNHMAYGAGLGVRVGGIRFGADFAYLPFDLLGDTQLIDLRVYF